MSTSESLSATFRVPCGGPRDLGRMLGTVTEEWQCNIRAALTPTKGVWTSVDECGRPPICIFAPLDHSLLSTADAWQLLLRPGRFFGTLLLLAIATPREPSRRRETCWRRAKGIHVWRNNNNKQTSADHSGLPQHSYETTRQGR